MAAKRWLLFFVVGFFATFLFANGLVMLVVPLKWYFMVRGVSDTGPPNVHFIRDIGLLYMLMGGAFAAGLFRPANRVALWGTASLWLSGHALFHLWEVAVGICAPSVIPRDFPAVTAPAILGLALTYWARQHWKKSPHSVRPRNSTAVRDTAPWRRR